MRKRFAPGRRRPSAAAASVALCLPLAGNAVAQAIEAERRFERIGVAEGKVTGLGLAVTRGIVEEHGGRIVFTDTGEPGSRFCVFLPLPTTEQPA